LDKNAKFERKNVNLGQILAGWPVWKLKMQMANFGKGKTAKFKGEKAILGQILAGWPFCKRTERPKRPK